MSINRIEQTLLSYLPYQRIIGVLGFALLILTAYRNRTTMGSLLGRATPPPELKKLEHKGQGPLYYSQLDDLITQVKHMMEPFSYENFKY